ncbi:MAG: biosynthetic-type acetolactate synthase large subunit [Prevotella sp.]|nr:biosynthetic-type acetolactate synthase large subunit [Prevotella sp.]
MDNEMITGSEVMMRALKAEGVTTIFGYPGGAIMPVYDMLYDYTRGEKKAFEHILVRHEQAAAHAAEGYARVSGKVGVALVTSGPGATNTLTGVADAMMDSTPIVVIAGQVPISSLGTDAFQEVDLVGVSQPISKWSYQIRRAEDIAWAVSRAFFIAKSGRPGPVVLDFAKNAQVEKIEYNPTKVNFVRSYVPSPALNEEAVRKAADMINHAQRPLALVGQGVELGDAHEELKAFLEKADIPAGRTMLGLSALSCNHPLNIGMLGMHGNYAPNKKEQECDVLIAIGMRFSDRVTGNLKTYAKQAKIIHLDIDKSEIDKNVKTDVAVVADCKLSLPAITALLEEKKHDEWKASFIPLMKQEQTKVIEPAIHPKEGMLLMGEVVNEVAEQTKGEAIVVTDVGQNQLFTTRYSRIVHKRSLCTSGGLGTMGYGMPAAIGATYGNPDRMVLCFMGDGGFQMCMEELGTIMEHERPVKMIMLNNHYLGNVRQWQDMFFERRKSFTKMKNPAYELIAQAYKIPYELVYQRENLSAAVERMLNTPGAYILECVILDDDDILPMTPPGCDIGDMLLEIQV